MLRRLRRRVLLGLPIARRLVRLLPTPVKQRLLAMGGMSGIHRYQDFRDPTAKAILIAEFLRRSVVSHPQSVLDVGCNAGEITRHLNKEGFLAVGIDLGEVLARVSPGRKHSALIPFEVGSESIPCLPSFDSVLLLSVHHQWVATNGDTAARRLVHDLSSRAGKTMVIEFSCLNVKYDKLNPELFIDNDTDSVTEYAFKWLAETLPNFGFEFLGLNEEHPSDEPHRVLLGGKRINSATHPRSDISQ